MAAWPAVKAALYAGAQSLPEFSDALVSLGRQASNDVAAKTFEVGFVNDENNAGTYARTPVYDGTVWGESGDVRSTLIAQVGDSDPSISEAEVFGMVDALDAWIQANPTLNDALSGDFDLRLAVDVLSVGNSEGTATELVLTLTYTTTDH